LSVLQLITSKEEQEAKMESLIDEFGLQQHSHKPSDLLSGGERRRTEIARCLATDPVYLARRAVCWCRPCCC
jgi:lipopolysaccharide export system ATP-binding protein